MPFFGQWGETGTGGGSARTFLGSWDANTNTPTIVNGTGTQGDFYIVSVAGSTNIDGTSTWAVGDEIGFNGTVWQRIPATGVTASELSTAITGIYSGLTEGQVIKKASGNAFEDSSLSDQGNNIDSTKSIQVPAASVLLGNNVTMSDIAGRLTYLSRLTNQLRVPITNDFTRAAGTVGSPTVSTVAAEEEDFVPTGVVDNGVLSDTSFSFTRQATANEIVYDFSVRIGPTAPVDPVTLTVYLGATADANSILSQQTIQPSAMIANTEQKFVLNVPVAFNAGSDVTVVAESTTSFDLRGDTGPSGTIWFSIDRQVVTFTNVATVNDITAQVQSNWNETNTSSPAFILNKPAIPTARTDEEIRNVIGTALVSGSGISIAVNDAANTITISANPASGGNPPPAPADIIYYGLMDTNIPATVDTATLTTQSDPTNPYTTSLVGPATAGQYYVILVPMNDDLVAITDTVNSIDVTSIFTATDNVRTINTVLYKSYVAGPLNAGFNETYILSFGS